MRHLLILLLVVLAPACVLTTAPAPGLARFAAGTETATTDYGTVALEAGAAIDEGESQAYPVRVMHGLTEDVEVYLDWSVYEKVDRPGLDEGEGIGDAGLGIRHRFWESAQGTSTAVEGRVSIPTGDDDEGTGSGSLDWFGSVMVSQEIDDVLLNGWIELGILGDALEDDTDITRAAALSIAANLEERLIGYAEVSRVLTETDDPAYLALGLGWRATAETTLDVGAAWGLNDEADDAVLFLGLRTNLGILGAQGPRLEEDLPR